MVGVVVVVEEEEEVSQCADMFKGPLSDSCFNNRVSDKLTLCPFLAGL